jgi:hypothetical protein
VADEKISHWLGRERWAPEDIKRGLRVRLGARGTAVLFQSSDGPDDNADLWYLVSEELCIVCPRFGTREEISVYLNKHKFSLAG